MKRLFLIWIFLSQRRRVSQRFFCYFFALLCAFARDFLINTHNFISYHFIEIFPNEHHREAVKTHLIFYYSL